MRSTRKQVAVCSEWQVEPTTWALLAHLDLWLLVGLTVIVLTGLEATPEFVTLITTGYVGTLARAYLGLLTLWALAHAWSIRARPGLGTGRRVQSAVPSLAFVVGLDVCYLLLSL